MFSGRKTKEFYIDLQDNRYYTPGEIVRGEVVLDLAKPTKINHIRVTLSGVVQVGASSLTLFNRECQIATAPDDSGRAHQLEAKSNRFPFELSIPGASAELPTSMKLGDGSGVRYTLSAVLKVPFSVIQTWSPQDSREISIVEQIDVSLPEYCARPRVDEQVRFQENTAVVSMKIPKVAIVRGDILPVTAIIKHYKAFQKPQCVKISLIRWFHQFGKGKSQPGLEKVVKSRKYDLKLTSENGFNTEIVAKLFIPQSVPPTTQQSGRILRVKYAAHIEVDLNTVNRDDPRYVESHFVKMDIPILIGTIPKAEVSIEDDESEEEESELSTTVANLKLEEEEEEEEQPSSPAPPSPVKSVPSSSVSEASAPSSPMRSLKSVPSSPTSDTHRSVPSSPTELPAPLSRDNSISSQLSGPSRRPTYESYPSRSSSQRSSSHIPQQRGMDHESVHSHASTPSTSPYISPSTSTASRSNSQRMAMPVAMPTPPQRHMEEFHYPRQQSPAMPMPMPHLSTGPPPGPYSTSPHNYYRPAPSTQFPHDAPPLPPPPPSCDNNFMTMPTPQMPWSPAPPYPYSAPDASSTPPPRYWS
ncbi:hypothetical protein BJV82DRAFT_148523 [Fennellomyces sp. T-0311]|nr:hypothetical protein BJV82DRAFT_148523 [Fennellomyces sp. T-0311]